MANVICLVALITIAALLAWSGARAWRAENTFLKWGGVGVAGLLVVAVALPSALTANTSCLIRTVAYATAPT